MTGAAGISVAEETEVYSMAPPSSEQSGFAGESVVKIEPKKGKPLQLQLKDLPPHKFLKIEALIDFNKIAGNSFGTIRLGGAVIGGAAGAAAPEKDAEGGIKHSNKPRLQVSVDGGDPVVDASLGSQLGNNNGGSFPDLDGYFTHRPGTGSTNGPLEVMEKAGRVRWKRVSGEAANKLKEHKVTFIIPHTASRALVEFNWNEPKRGGAAAGMVVISGMVDQSPYSIKQLSASVIDAPEELSAEEFSSRYKLLGSGTPVEAMQALNDMVLAGRSVLPLLEEEINRPADPDLEKKFKDALAGMDDPDFAKRAAAAKALSGLGPEVVPLAKRVLANNDGLSVEVEKTLKNLADQIEKGSGARVDQSRTNRLHRLLALIGSDEANKLKETLPEPQLVVDPSIQGQGNKARAVPGVIEMDLGGAAGGAVFKLEGGVLKGEAMAIPVRPAVPKVPAEPKKEEKPGK